jgi:tungstate transport system permease protein
MIIGGNIRGFTRVLTTAIALETSMGNLSLSIALGIILLSIALVVTVFVYIVQER